MRMNIYTILFLFALIGCEKNTGGGIDVPPPPPSDSTSTIVQWEWIQDAPQFDGLPINPVIFKDWYIVPIFEAVKSKEQVFVFNKYTGELEWTYDFPDEIFPRIHNLEIWNDYLLIVSIGGFVCLDMNSRQEVWRYKLQNWEEGDNDIYINGNFLYAENRLILDDKDTPFMKASHVTKYDMRTGEREIILYEERIDSIEASPSFNPLVVYQNGGRDYYIFQRDYQSPIIGPRELTLDLVCMDAQTKEIVWENKQYCEIAAGWNFSPVIYGDRVIVCGDWSLYCFDAKTGEFIWRHEFVEMKPSGGFMFTGPYLLEGVIYAIGTSGLMYALDADTGDEIWKNVIPPKLEGGVYLGPAPVSQDDLLIREGYLFTNTLDGDFMLFDASTGEEVERHKANRRYVGQNILYDEESDLYYICTWDKLKAFRLRK